MISLPSRPDRDVLAGFWSVLGLGAGISAATLGVLAGWPHPVAVGAACALVLGGIGVASPEAARRLYALWNRAARAYGRRARPVILTVYYYAAFTAGRLAGSKVPMRRTDDHTSGWTPRRSLLPEEYASQAPSAGAAGDGWWPVVVARWSLRSGRPWVIALLPLLVLLRGLDSDETEEVESNIYTLY